MIAQANQNLCQSGAAQQPSFMSAAQLIAAHPNLRPFVIEGLLRQGEVANLIAPAKAGKSWLAMQIALSVAAGVKLFDRFSVSQGNVLILDNELHPETLAHRLPIVGQAMKLADSDWIHRVHIQPLRGGPVNLTILEQTLVPVLSGQYKIVILDAFYRFLNENTDENDNVAITQVYDKVDELAASLGSAFVLVHHSSKGSQATKAVTDVGSGAGSQSRAADTHIVLRRHKAENVVVLDAAVRSWKPVDSFCLERDACTWKPATHLDPADLHHNGRQRKHSGQSQAAKPTPKTWTVEEFVQSFVTESPVDKKIIVKRANEAGVSLGKANSLVADGLHCGLLHQWRLPSDRRVLLANRPQSHDEATPDSDPIKATGDVSHTHEPPHTPRGTQERPREWGLCLHMTETRDAA